MQRPTRPQQHVPRRRAPHARAASALSPRLVEEYLIVHQSEGHSPKTLEWHRTALGLLVRFLERRGVTDPHEFETSHLRCMGGLARHAREHETASRSHLGFPAQQAHDPHLHALGPCLRQVALR